MCLKNSMGWYGGIFSQQHFSNRLLLATSCVNFLIPAFFNGPPPPPPGGSVKKIFVDCAPLCGIPETSIEKGQGIRRSGVPS